MQSAAVDAAKCVPAQTVTVGTVIAVERTVFRVALAALAHWPHIPSTVAGTAARAPVAGCGPTAPQVRPLAAAAVKGVPAQSVAERTIVVAEKTVARVALAALVDVALRMVVFEQVTVTGSGCLQTANQAIGAS